MLILGYQKIRMLTKRDCVMQPPLNFKYGYKVLESIS